LMLCQIGNNFRLVINQIQSGDDFGLASHQSDIH
jgi:hypothetical protein